MTYSDDSVFIMSYFHITETFLEMIKTFRKKRATSGWTTLSGYELNESPPGEIIEIYVFCRQG